MGKWWLIGCALFLGCTHSVAVRAPRLVPAQVPVRSFPSIWISGGMLSDEIYLQDRLATHLAKDGVHEVRRVDLADLEPARKAGQIPASTVVVLIELDTEEDSHTGWDTVPVSVCGYYGCYTQYQSYPTELPEMRGTLTMTVYEGPTARVLQRARFKRVVYGDEDEAEDKLVDILARDIELAVDTLRVRDKVELYDIDVPGVRDAIREIRRGHWDKGRALLEGAKDQVAGKSKKTQARFCYNLGLARWFAPGPHGLTQQAYEHARSALLEAEKIAHNPAHQRMLNRLDKARKDFALIEEQARATAANFALAAEERALTEESERAPEEQAPATQDEPHGPAGASSQEGAAPEDTPKATPPVTELPKPPKGTPPKVVTPPPPPTP